MSKPLTLVYNASLEKGIFLQAWKLARVTPIECLNEKNVSAFSCNSEVMQYQQIIHLTPIYKAGTKTDINNYRPISVLSAVSRILETIAHDQLMEYLKGQNKLCLNQFAFQKLHSKLTCLLNVIDPGLKNSDEGKIILSIFPDLKKHSIL